MVQSTFPTSYVTGGGASAPGTEAPTADVVACPACLHAVSDHDPISLRFCRATAASTAEGATPRGCICRA
jgi:hypothetical protein